MLRVILLWWTVLLVYWAWDNPAGIQSALDRLNGLRGFFGMDPVGPPLVTVLTDASALGTLFASWTLPALGVVGVAVVLGIWLAELQVRGVAQARAATIAPSERWRGASITLGTLPQPPAPAFVETPLPEAFHDMPSPYKEFLHEVLNVLAGYPNAYAGPGHAVTLLEHTTNVLAKSKEAGQTALQLCLAAAHDLGKISAYTRSSSGEWRLEKSHERESARWTSRLSSWADLSETERQALILALNYFHTPELLPSLGSNKEASRQAKLLLKAVTVADQAATAEEKQAVLDSTNLPGLALRALLDNLPKIPFQIPGTGKGQRAAAFKKGHRVYLLEAPFRDRVLPTLSSDIVAALGRNFRIKGQMHPLTVALCQALHQEGWLVTSIESMSVSPKMPLWRLRSGTSEFSGVLVMDFPENLIDLLPSQNTTYDLTILGPQARQDESLDKGLMASLLGGLPPPAELPAAPEPASELSTISAEPAGEPGGDSVPKDPLPL